MNLSSVLFQTQLVKIYSYHATAKTQQCRSLRLKACFAVFSNLNRAFLSQRYLLGSLTHKQLLWHSGLFSLHHTPP